MVPAEAVDAYKAHPVWGQFVFIEAIDQSGIENPVPASSLTINAQELTLLVGSTDKLTATVSPENVTDKTVTWTSDNEAVVIVDADGSVTAISVGVAYISATCGNATATCKVTVNPVTASALTINAQKLTLLVGATDKLIATVSPENVTDKTITWTSDNEAVVSVDTDGTVTAISVGVAYISATCGNASATCKIIVNPEPSVSDFTYTYLGQTITYSVTNSTDRICSVKGHNNSSGTLVLPEHPLDNNGNEYTLTSIGEDAFCECSGLNSIEIPNSVTSIGDHAFIFCTGLTSVSIPNSVTSIGYATFANCSALTSITIPSTVTSIGEYAFYGCKWLVEVNCYATVPPSAIIDSFDWSNYNVTRLKVPAEAVDAYKAHPVWGQFVFIEAIDQSGIEDVIISGDEEQQESHFDIYNLRGVLIKRDATDDDLNELKPDVYILHQGSKSRKISVR